MVRLGSGRRECFAAGVATRSEDLRPDKRLEAQEPGYAEWKRAKIERVLTHSKDRAAMIPAERIWRDLGLLIKSPKRFVADQPMTVLSLG